MNSAEKVQADIAAWKAQGIQKADLMTRIGEDEIGWPYAWGATGQKCTVANREARINNKKIGDGDKQLIRDRCQVLNGSKSSCNGCKYFPGGERTKMYDCIGFVNQLLDWAEVPHYGGGCSTMWNHNANWEQKGNLANMPETPCCVFQQEPGNASKMQHIGFYIGGGYVIHCSKEVKKQKIGDYPWTHFGIPKGLGGDVPVPTDKPTLRRGSTGPYVVELQKDLICLFYDLEPYGADGKFGKKTETAVKEFQGEHTGPDGKALKMDGIVGQNTWWALDNAVQPQPTPYTLYTVIIPHLTEEQAEELQKQYPDAEKRTEGGGSR